jgi:hypothetical protein
LHQEPRENLVSIEALGTHSRQSKPMRPARARSGDPGVRYLRRKGGAVPFGFRR